MVEAGDFYENKAKNKLINDPCPFCLYGPTIKMYKWYFLILCLLLYWMIYIWILNIVFLFNFI